MTDFARRIEQQRGRIHLPIGHLLLRFFAGERLPCSPGAEESIVSQTTPLPVNSFCSVLHVVALVMFLHEGTAGVEPFEDDVFAFEFALMTGSSRWRPARVKSGRGAADSAEIRRRRARRLLSIVRLSRSSFVFIFFIWCERHFRRG